MLFFTIFASIKYVYAMEKIKNFFGWLRRWISPVYVAMVVAAFILWFITKLGGTYTTEHDVTVVIDNVEYNVDCTIKGKGVDLVHYTLSSDRSRFVIPISDLTQDKPMNDNNGNIVVHVTAESMKIALAQRMNHIEVVSVGSVPVIINEHIEDAHAVVEAPVVEVPKQKSAVVKQEHVVEEPAIDMEEPIVLDEISFDDVEGEAVSEN